MKEKTATDVPLGGFTAWASYCPAKRPIVKVMNVRVDHIK